MTQNSSRTRLALYVATAMVTAATVGLSSVDFGDMKEVASFALGIIGTGLITARSYIDKSPSEVTERTPPL